MPDQTLDPLLDVTTASGLLPAGTALSTFADNKRSCFGKSDIWFGDKALGLKATVADVIRYCQLGKMDAGDISRVRFSHFNKTRENRPISKGLGFGNP